MAAAVHSEMPADSDSDCACEDEEEPVVLFEDLFNRYTENRHGPFVACLRYLAGRCDSVWKWFSRCILVDFTYGFVWSRLLSFLSLMLVVWIFAEQAFDIVLFDVKSCANCFAAREIGRCRLNGNLEVDDWTQSDQVMMDPFGEVRLTLEGTSVNALFLAMLIALANTRYLKESCCIRWVVRPLVFLVLVTCTFSCMQTLRFCVPNAVNFSEYSPDGDLVVPSPAARQVAEYCAPSQPDYTRHTLEAQVSHSVTRLWAAWMDNTTFVVDLTNRTYSAQYCEDANLPLRPCLEWMNASFIGNSISCMLPLDVHANLLPMMSDETIWETLFIARCRAHISGKNFGFSVDSLAALLAPAQKAQHVLSLATRGFQCPQFAAAGLGPGQLLTSTDGSACAYDKRLLQLVKGELIPKKDVAPYLQQHYFECSVQEISSCQERQWAAPRTTFRNAVRAVALLSLTVAYIWMLVLRRSARRNEPEWFLPVSIMGKLSMVLTSRVVLGLVVSLMLQVGFTILVVRKLFPWLEQMDLPMLPPHFISRFGKEMCVLQCIIVLVAVAYNMMYYSRLREQLLRLPRATFYGEDGVTPASYQGPDLRELREMGSSSVLYAAYLPGLIFWRFFFGSWMIGFIFCVPLALFRFALQPVTGNRLKEAEGVWHFLAEFIFIGSILFSHFLTRLFLQRCLLRYREEGFQFRCLCLFSWWEVMTCLLSLALGPWTALYDFGKGFLSTTVASLILHKPNFVQFGELSDYVYCTYCASLYLERVAFDDHADHMKEWRERRRKKDLENVSDGELSGEYEDLASDSDDYEAWWLQFREDNAHVLEEDAWRFKCIPRTCIFLGIFILLPWAVKLGLDYVGTLYGYGCENVGVLPSPFCTSEHHAHEQAAHSLAEVVRELVNSTTDAQVDVAVAVAAH
eukprot:TRINITY_DN17726_c0_g1_i1.p1 TRINITY_DN17726_c0_g1~~TRINITY_DN17726_c0_g1_i1.p1  ORF type:complete len:912 (+),score=138.38 TRINITY_DN17726_c0_g1_i1:57-2792(+)